MKTKRADIYLTELGFCKSRNVAKKMIEQGSIKWRGNIISKPSQLIDAEDIEILNALKYVGRGGLKLEKAIETFDITIEGKRCMDIGASTGGFTDCMIQNGALSVIAVDVGHDQLDKSLVNNPKVFSMEGVNFRYFDKSTLDYLLDFITIDVSFISLKHILEIARDILIDNGDIIALIKPQFELGKKISKDGIVKDRKDHLIILNSMVEYFSSIGLSIVDLTHSPIKGGSGNVEYLAHLKKDVEGSSESIDIVEIIDSGFAIKNKRE